MAEHVVSGLVVGRTGVVQRLVTAEQTAIHVGSGSLPVFATPMMVALMEAAAVAALDGALPDTSTSLGVDIHTTHVAATPVGLMVTATARLSAIDGRALSFEIEAHDGHEIIGRAAHKRVVVDAGRFMGKVAQKAQGAG